MQIPLISGRYFDARDSADAERAIIINESMAHSLWPDQNPISRSVDVKGGSTVIGVVGNVRHGSLEDPGSNEMYLNYHQTDDWPALEMVVRSRRPVESLVPDVRRALGRLDPNLPSGEFYPLEQLIDNAVGPRRLFMQLLGSFSTVALALAAIGLYGVIAYSVVQRTHEIGIRMAIGAQRRDVLKLILRGGLKLVALGIVLGLAGAFAFTRVLQSLLFGVTAHDPLIFHQQKRCATIDPHDSASL
jgi:ABC-type antimicrobial peptide transport system permease subunit